MRGRPWTIDENVSTVFSKCGKHRFVLDCIWDSTKPLMTFVLLNPSIASNDICDPTVDKCIHFAKRDDYGSISIINLFSKITPRPQNLLLDETRTVDENEGHILNVIKQSKKVVVAWGEEGAWFHMNHKVLTLLRDQKLYCLGTNRYGFPRHPGRLPKDTKIKEFII